MESAIVPFGEQLQYMKLTGPDGSIVKGQSRFRNKQFPQSNVLGQQHKVIFEV